MGIHGLTQLLMDRAGGCYREGQMKNYFGRVVAIDASMSIYQFLIAMKALYEVGGGGGELQDEQGNTTSHLQGLFARTLRMVSEGLRPVYVFDGKPPAMKQKELDDRRLKAEEARKALELAEEQGDAEAVEKLSKRTVRVSKEQTQECKRLLTLMGLPVVDAATEAEAQCAELVRVGKAWAVGTEDMDALTFGAKILLRHLNFSEAKKAPILEFHLESVLEGLGLTRDQFVDLCILLGCDYCGRVAGIGPKKAFDGIKTHGTIEKFLASIDQTKHKVPADWQFESARDLFRNPEVFPGEDIDLQFKDPDVEGLIQFLCVEKNFSRARVEAGVEKLKAARQKKEQRRLDAFFSVKSAPVATGAKRKVQEKRQMGTGKLQKGAGGKKVVRR